MSFGATWTDYSTQGFDTDPKVFEFSSWDAGKTRGCVCDATFGDVDCSKRMCPYGNDVLDVRDDLYETQYDNVQQITFVANYQNNTGSITDLNGQTFALTFTSKLNETFTTIPIVFSGDGTGAYGDADMRNDVQLALLSLPNKVIDGVTVSLTRMNTSFLYPDADQYSKAGTSAYNNFYRVPDGYNVLQMRVTFTGSAVQGRQNFLTVEDYECHDGCTPKLTGLGLSYKYDHFNSNITNVVDPYTANNIADFNSYECGRRGKCDYGTGLCQCFAGYFGDNCNTLTTLV
jgi:hypothetical protein